jgi:hypothetical protein
MHAPGFWAAARPESLQSKTPCGQICMQRPQATQALSLTTTWVEPAGELLWPPALELCP